MISAALLPKTSKHRSKITRLACSSIAMRISASIALTR
jgi:hypothetical protein